MLPQNQKQIILNTAVANGLKAEWDFAFAMYKSMGDVAFLDAMTRSRDSSTLNRYGYLINQNKKNLLRRC